MAPTIISAVKLGAVAQFSGQQPLDLIDLADVKQEIEISTTKHDPWLLKAITRSSKLISRYCDRVFQPQTYQEKFWAYRDPYPWQLPTGFFPLQLAAWPLVSQPSTAWATPPQQPKLSAVSSGALAAATYYVKISYVTPTGETAASIEAFLPVAANNLVSIEAPGPDFYQVATGYNVYIGATSFGETRQNSSPISISETWTLPTSGVTTGAALPPYILAVENFPYNPQPLAEGIDFISDYNAGAAGATNPDFSKSWLTRLFHIDHTPRRWNALPIWIEYQAGYEEIPDDLSDATMQLIKARWFARTRDPGLRSENIAGAYEAAYWFGSGPGSEGDLPPNIMAMLDRYRVPVLA